MTDDQRSDDGPASAADGSTAGGDSDGDRGLLDRLDAFPLPAGVASGVGAFLAGYVAFFVLVVTTGNVSFGQGVWTVLRQVAYRYYNAFNVPTHVEVTRSLGGGNASMTVSQQQWSNPITGWRRVVQNGQEQTAVLPTDLPVPALVYLAVPVLALLVAGYVYADQHLDATTDANELTLRSALGTVALALGFLFVALVGTFLFVQRADQATVEGFVRPARFETLLYGVVYPLAAGGVGIVLGQVVPALVGGDDGDAGTGTETTSENTDRGDDGPR